MGSVPVGAQCPLSSSLGEFLGYWDWLWYPGLLPVLVSSAFPFAFHISVFSFHSSSPAIGFHSSIFHGGGICTPPPTLLLIPDPSLRIGTVVIGYPKRLRYHGGGVINYKSSEVKQMVNVSDENSRAYSVHFRAYFKQDLELYKT